VLALQRADSTVVATLSTAGKDIEYLLAKEWLLTNSRGGYSCSTVVGCNTRRYHGLLIGSPNPLTNRIMALANCLEMVIVNKETPDNGSHDPSRQQVFNLSTFEFNEKFAPAGFQHVTRFRRDLGAHVDFEFEHMTLTKSVYLLHNADTVALVYDFASIGSAKQKHGYSSIDFIVRPMVGLRDFHGLQKSYARMHCTPRGDGVTIRQEVGGSCELFIAGPSMEFSHDPQWWFNFVYRRDRQRGQEFTEDLWSPGFFRSRLDSDARVVIWAGLSSGCAHDATQPAIVEQQTQMSQVNDVEALCRQLQTRRRNIYVKAASVNRNVRRALLHHSTDTQKSSGKGFFSDLLANGGANNHTAYDILCLAADQFIAQRRINGPHQQEARTTILAGFPWFADWGRDTLISLPDLLLLTGRFDEAKSVLMTFAQAADEGMIPNRFDDYSGTAYFNSIDASLWFINAAFQYLRATNDTAAFTQHLLPTVRWIVDRYISGTRFDIHADADGLITGGSDETQLTWMDAKCDGVAFTCRCGKAVEVNALWYNGISYLTEFYAERDPDTAARYGSLAQKVRLSFSKAFWNDDVGYLNDRILPDGSPDPTLRPNQVFAVSLGFSPLEPHQAKSVVDVVEKELLTPYGLRTLNVNDSQYRGSYTGDQRSRDQAYHQGTIWPYLIGPFVEAYLKVNRFSRKSRKTAAEFIRPLIKHLIEDACLGQVSEIFDGDPPHHPRGCFAQAWSVAGLIRAYHLIND